MYVPSDMPRRFKALSIKVCRILDAIAASDQVRRLWMKNATSYEILENIPLLVTNVSYSFYIMGSVFEGSRTVDMKSDFDFLQCIEHLEVVQNIEEAREHKNCLLAVRDSHTKPGYTKLQYVFKGEPMSIKPIDCKPVHFKTDFKGRVVHCKDHPYHDVKETDESHGPAKTILERPGIFAADRVIALRCKKWPRPADAFLSRERKFNWPPKRLIEQMQSLGFFVVKVGHPASPERDLEWRISLSLQERLLMQSLNVAQFQCYVLLKLIKTDLLNQMVDAPSVTSYHLKTCLFYTIEQTPESLWKQENLLFCLQKCLVKLLEWTKSGNCPNYFIPDENMFERKVFGSTQRRLKVVLENLLTSDFHYLLFIRCDNFGKKLMQSSVVQKGKIYRQLPGYIGKQIILIIHSHLNTLLSVRRRLVHFGACESALESFNKFVRLNTKLRNVHVVTEHTKQDTTKSISLLLPYIEECIMSNAIVCSALTASQRQHVVNCLFSNKWNEVCKKSDCFSSKLKQATYLHKSGFYEASLAVLESIRNACGMICMSGCKCKEGRLYCHPIYGDCLRLLVENLDLSDEDFRSKFWAPCVIFLPTERRFLPECIQYEMERLASVKTVSQNWDDCFYIWASIDSQVLLCFLQYLNYNKLGLNKESKRALIRLGYQLLLDPNLGHKETGLNIFGWALKNEGELLLALKIFQLSLVLQKYKNAAVWHLGVAFNQHFQLLVGSNSPGPASARSETATQSDTLILSLSIHNCVNMLCDYFQWNLSQMSAEYILGDNCPRFQQNPSMPLPPGWDEW